MPIDSPTVPIAEVTSNKSSKNVKFSVKSKIPKPTAKTKNVIIRIANDFFILSKGIFLPSRFISGFPFKSE